MLKETTQDKVTAVVEKYRKKPGTIISVLEEIQETYGYLPKAVLARVSDALNVPLSRLFSLATFYSAFTLNPRGKHTIHVCLGTACHVRGAPRVVEELSRILNVAPGDTTADDRFTLETVRCIGCCSLAPAMTVGKNIYGHTTMSKIPGILKKYQETT